MKELDWQNCYNCIWMDFKTGWCWNKLAEYYLADCYTRSVQCIFWKQYTTHNKRRIPKKRGIRQIRSCEE